MFDIGEFFFCIPELYISGGSPLWGEIFVYVTIF